MALLKLSAVDVEAVIRAHAGQGQGSCAGIDRALTELEAEVERLREALRQVADSDWCAPFVRSHARDALDA